MNKYNKFCVIPSDVTKSVTYSGIFNYHSENGPILGGVSSVHSKKCNMRFPYVKHAFNAC